MNRAFFEWGFIALAGASLCTLAWWIDSSCVDTRNLNLMVPVNARYRIRAASNQGWLVIGDNVLSGELADVIDQGTLIRPTAQVVRIALPGFRYYKVEWTPKSANWAMKMSLLLLAMAFLLLSLPFLCGYVLVRRRKLALVKR